MERTRLATRLSPVLAMNLKRLFSSFEDVRITRLFVAYRDRDVSKFLELAVNGRANAIISDDADLLVFKRFENIAIMSPTVFVQDFI